MGYVLGTETEALTFTDQGLQVEPAGTAHAVDRDAPVNRGGGLLARCAARPCGRGPSASSTPTLPGSTTTAPRPRRTEQQWLASSSRWTGMRRAAVRVDVTDYGAACNAKAVGVDEFNPPIVEMNLHLTADRDALHYTARACRDARADNTDATGDRHADADVQVSGRRPLIAHALDFARPAPRSIYGGGPLIPNYQYCGGIGRRDPTAAGSKFIGARCPSGGLGQRRV